MMNRIRKTLLAATTAAIAISCGCHQSVRKLTVQTEPTPVAEASLVPQVTPLAPGRIVVSWQRPLSTGGFSFEMAIRDRERWSDVRKIASGENLSMFSADLPAVAQLPNGNLLAYWEVKDTAEDDLYATTIQTAISADEGQTWGQVMKPYGKASSGQHSFISWFPDREGIGLLWLDADQRSKVRHASMEGKAHADDTDMGSIGLRYAALNTRGEVAHDLFVDPITCECCPTSAAVTARGPVAVYRGRQEAPETRPSEVNPNRPTVRDIYITRLQAGKWTRPHPVHTDNWIINACPDNGPAVDANGNNVAVTWWTSSNDQPKVLVAFSSDAADTFGKPARVDTGHGEGQVTLALLPGGQAAIVGWLEDGQTWARFVKANGEVSSATALGPSPRHSRLPRWIANDSRSVTAVWTKKDQGGPHLSISRVSF